MTISSHTSSKTSSIIKRIMKIHWSRLIHYLIELYDNEWNSAASSTKHEDLFTLQLPLATDYGTVLLSMIIYLGYTYFALLSC